MEIFNFRFNCRPEVHVSLVYLSPNPRMENRQLLVVEIIFLKAVFVEWLMECKNNTNCISVKKLWVFWLAPRSAWANRRVTWMAEYVNKSTVSWIEEVVMWPWPMLVKGVWGGVGNSRRILKGPQWAGVCGMACRQDGKSWSPCGAQLKAQGLGALWQPSSSIWGAVMWKGR